MTKKEREDLKKKLNKALDDRDLYTFREVAENSNNKRVFKNWIRKNLSFGNLINECYEKAYEKYFGQISDDVRSFGVSHWVLEYRPDIHDKYISSVQNILKEQGRQNDR